MFLYFEEFEVWRLQNFVRTISFFWPLTHGFTLINIQVSFSQPNGLWCHLHAQQNIRIVLENAK